jgi:hypothetical protein
MRTDLTGGCKQRARDQWDRYSVPAITLGHDGLQIAFGSGTQLPYLELHFDLLQSQGNESVQTTYYEFLVDIYGHTSYLIIESLQQDDVLVGETYLGCGSIYIPT